MRQSQKSNRSRGRGNRKGGGGGNNLNRVYDSAGPEGKVRGTPQQIIDKYLTLARDAQTSGDRVSSENFLQHAEHYQRILISAMTEQEKARRDSAAQATDDDEDDDQPSAMEVADTPSNDGGRDGRDQNRRRKAPSADIEGMTTIDSGEEAAPLVVAAEEMDNSQPRESGNGSARRPRRRAPKSDGDTPKAEKKADSDEETAQAADN